MNLVLRAFLAWKIHKTPLGAWSKACCARLSSWRQRRWESYLLISIRRSQEIMKLPLANVCHYHECTIYGRDNFSIYLETNTPFQTSTVEPNTCWQRGWVGKCYIWKKPNPLNCVWAKFPKSQRSGTPDASCPSHKIYSTLWTCIPWIFCSRS